jgi:ferredoxin--NADP+ reductase
MTIPELPLRVAIVGSGPSGFYAAEALQKAVPGVKIDLFDRLPTPFGLVRGGVAPDHPKIKSVTRIFERIATHPGFRFIGNVRIGTDAMPADLSRHYDAVIYAVGAETDRHLDIPGESLPGSHAATELVGWYNGHPDYCDAHFDLATSAAAVVGLGNVAMDVTRVLAADPKEFEATDLAFSALTALRGSRLKTVHVIGRRGPVQAAFTTPELRELGELEQVDVIVDRRDLELDPVSADYLANSGDRNVEKNLELLRSWAGRGATGRPRQIIFHFNASPLAIIGNERVEELLLARNALVPDGRGSVRAEPTDEVSAIKVGLVFRSVGYRGVPIVGLPFDQRSGVIPNTDGRVVEHEGSHTYLPGVYVCGWIKRGPSGVIGTNKTCAAQTVDHLLADAISHRIPTASGNPDELVTLLAANGARVTSWADWQRLDAAEIARGAQGGRPREKLVRIQEMLATLDQSP